MSSISPQQQQQQQPSQPPPPLAGAPPPAAASSPTLRLENFLNNVLRKDLQKVLEERDNCYNAASQCVQLRQLLTDLLDLGKVRQVSIMVGADGVGASDEATALVTAGLQSEEAPLSTAASRRSRGEEGDNEKAESSSTTSASAREAAINKELSALLMGNSSNTSGADTTTTTTVLHKRVTVCDDLVPDPTPLQLLVDVSGNNYFAVETASPAASSSGSAAAPLPSAAATSSNTNNSNYHFFMTADVANPALVHINIGCGVIAPMGHEEAVLFLKKKEKLLRDASQRLSRESLRVRFRIRLVMEAITRLEDQAMGFVGPPQK